MNEACGELIASSPITYEEAKQIQRNVSVNLHHEHFVQIIEVMEEIHNG